MGHQYGGNHSQNNNCNRAASAAVEVGSGITIMGYAGICPPDVAAHSIASFGGYSCRSRGHITTGASSGCPTTAPIPNSAPTALAGVDRTIPRSTPFILTASATDPNGGNVLSYSWEQMDNAVATMPPVATNTGGPAWVPLLPLSTPVRYMPNLPAVTANTTPTWEVLSSVARTYNFRLTVRDNVPAGGCNGQDNMVVTVSGTTGPFPGDRAQHRRELDRPQHRDRDLGCGRHGGRTGELRQRGHPALHRWRAHLSHHAGERHAERRQPNDRRAELGHQHRTRDGAGQRQHLL